MGDDLREIHRQIVCLHAQLSAAGTHILQQLGTAEQALGRDTAYVQAGAAQMLFFHNGHAGAQLSRPDGRYISAGAAADDNDILFHNVLLCQNCLSSLV